MRHQLLNIDWSFFDLTYLGEKVSNYLLCAGIILATLLLKRPVATLLTRISSNIASRFSYMKHKDAVRNMLFKPMERLLQTILYYIAVNQMDSLLDKVAIHHYPGQKENFNLRLGDVIDHVFLFLFIIFLTQLVTHFMNFIYYLRIGKAQTEKNQSRLQLLPLMNEMTKLLVWALSIFWILGSVFHVNVPALITGLGIGGIAIALAGKETVESFFAAFTILSDKPFQTGDTIKIGDANALGSIEGVVERIGFRSTRLRSTDGSTYVIPNQNLVRQNLINLSMRDTRGMKVVVNIRYEITHEDLQQLIAKLKEELLRINLVKEPVEITIEAFDKETFQLVISYSLPHPLPAEAKLTEIKRDINMKVFEIISKNTKLGTPIVPG